MTEPLGFRFGFGESLEERYVELITIYYFINLVIYYSFSFHHSKSNAILFYSIL